MYPCRLFLCLVLATLFSLSSTAQLREKIRGIDNGATLKGLSFYSPKEGFFATLNNVFFFTPDSATTYVRREVKNDNVDFNGQAVNLTFGFLIESVHAFGKDELLLGGDYGNVPAILYSSDNGQTFKLVFHNQAAPTAGINGVGKIVFPGGGNTGFAISRHHILKTTDRGKNWQILRTDLVSDFNSLAVPTTNHVYVMGRNAGPGQFLRSSDGGNTWSEVALPENTYLSAMAFSDHLHGWIAINRHQEEGGIYRTTDGGLTWQLYNDPKAAPMKAILMHFENEQRGLAALYGKEIYRTDDGGRTWDRIPRDNNFTHYSEPVNELHFVNSNMFWTTYGNQLQLCTNAQATAIPVARFGVDTTGFYLHKKVKLRNESNPAHQFRWMVDGKVLGTTYDLEYDYIQYSNVDDIDLIAYNNQYSDSIRIRFEFPTYPLITDFEPKAAGEGDTVKIHGFYFDETTEVTMGGVPVKFKRTGSSLIEAIVQHGTTGSIMVKSRQGTGEKAGFTFIEPPVMTGFAPQSGKPGDVIIITGENLEAIRSITFGGLPARSYQTLSPQRLEVVLGDAGDGKVEVKTAGGIAFKTDFKALPVLHAAQPMASAPGSYITLSGSGLDNLESLAFGTRAAMKITVHSPASIEVLVPESAGNTIRATKHGTMGELTGFQLLQPPVILAVHPAAACPDSVVTIKGLRFSAIASDNIVTFGSLRAQVTSATENTLSVIVPKGAGYSHINVLVNGLTARSPRHFVPRLPKTAPPSPGNFRDSSIIILNFPENRPYWKPIITDIDQDGYTDLLYGNFAADLDPTAKGDTILYVFLNSGKRDLMFAAPIKIKLENYLEVALMDIDGDGKEDLLVNDANRVLRFYRNTSRPGQPSFQQLPYSYSIGVDYSLGKSHHAYDLDGDGKLDLVYRWNNSVYISRNVSQAGKTRFDDLEFRTLSGTILQCMDINGDGKPELVSDKEILINHSIPGKLDFNLVPVTEGSIQALADVDGDQTVEAVMLQNKQAERSNSSLHIRTLTESADQLQWGPPVETRSPYYIDQLDMADMDHDGKPDILVRNWGNEVSYARNLSSSENIAFAAPVAVFANHDRGLQPFLVAAADFDRDGRQDLLVENTLEINKLGSATVWFNDATAGPVIDSVSREVVWEGQHIMVYGRNFTGTTAVKLGNLSNATFSVLSDSVLEITAGPRPDAPLKLTTPFGEASYSRIAPRAPEITSIEPAKALPGATVTIRGHHLGAAGEQTVFFGSVKAAVLSGDSTRITAEVPANAPDAYIYVNHASLIGRSPVSFTTILQQPSKEIQFEAPSIFAFDGNNGNLADLDGDGKLDVYSVTDMYIAQDEVRAATVEILMNRSTLDSIKFEPVPQSLRDRLHGSHIAGDFDGDGKLDFVTHSFGLKGFYVHRNTSSPGQLSFAAPVMLPVQENVYGMAWFSDLDKDGKMDLIVNTQFEQVVHRNISGNGQFAFEPAYNLESAVMADYQQSFAVRDVDGDGMDDMLVRLKTKPNHHDQYTWGILLNESRPARISFRTVPLDVTAYHWGPVSLQDLDGDGRPDLIPNSHNSSSWAPIYRNVSTPGNIQMEQTEWEWGLWRPFSYVVDLNKDGMPDRVKADFPYGMLRIERNDGSEGNPELEGVFETDGIKTSYLLIGDLNGDAKPDIALTQANEKRKSNLYIYPNRTGDDIRITRCEGSPGSLTAGMNGTAYRWQRKSGEQFADLQNGNGFSGVDTRTLQIERITMEMDGSFRCVVDEKPGVAIKLKVQPKPVANAGRDTVTCEPGDPIRIGAPPIAGYSYKWAGGDTLSYHTVQNGWGGMFVLTVTDQAGCLAVDTVQVEVRKIKQAVIFGTGPNGTVLCSGAPTELVAQPAQTYEWYKDNILLTEETGQVLAVTRPGFYEIAGRKDGCPQLRIGLPVREVAAVPTPVITANGRTLQSTYPGINSWYRDNQFVGTSEGPTFFADLPGSYSCMAHVNPCSSAMSNAISISGAKSDFTVENVVGGPNPVDNVYHIRFPENSIPIEMTVYNMSGDPVTGKITFTSSYDLPVGHLNKGIYFVHLVQTTTAKKIVKRFVKP
ncbi:FG-GAP-like repeat-containing protein [Chitinophaga sp. NPDC101104]|uniref:FG-GAP-like repeat-containing protein n=1 Tax=Chitinophaga sp. NPDC101104 TaxID=3390561 RepID=UPI003D06F062